MAKLIAILMLVFVVSSCAQPEYWVSGLTLPPGSTVVSKTETKSAPGAPGMTMPFMGEIEKSLVVGFNCPAGWDAVEAHIGGSLTGKGYRDELGQMGDMMSGAGGGEEAAAMMKYMKMYSKDDSKMVVSLQGMEAMMSEMGAPGGADMGSLGMGEFQLVVMRVK